MTKITQVSSLECREIECNLIDDHKPSMGIIILVWKLLFMFVWYVIVWGNVGKPMNTTAMFRYVWYEHHQQQQYHELCFFLNSW